MSSAAVPPSRKVVILGANGCTTPFTVNALTSLIGADNITVVTRDPDCAMAGRFASKGVHILKGDSNSKDSLVRPLTGISAFFLVTPGSEDRAELVANAVAAAKTARVPYMLVISVPTAGEATLFGSQFGKIEECVKASGIPYTLLRCPMFSDNYEGMKDDIRATGQIQLPMDPSKPFTTVCLRDLGDAAANILANPGPHANRTYTLAGPAYTGEQLATAFSTSLGRRISYIHVPYDTAKAAFLRRGWQEWQVVGVLEMYKAIDAGRYLFKSDLRSLIGREGMGIEEWVEAHKSSFML